MTFHWHKRCVGSCPDPPLPARVCYARLTGAMSRRRKDSMTAGSEKWSTRHSHHWFCQLLREWEEQLATTFYKRLAAMLSEKRDVPYSKMMGWIRCRMSFSLLRASVMSIRGTRSSATRGALHEPIELQATEGQLQVV